MKLKETFSTVPNQYDQYRLQYPAGLFRKILKYANLTPTDKILEIGIGTGIATKQLAKISNPITAVDLSPELIKIAKKRLKRSKSQIKYITKSFEQAPLHNNSFSLAFSATAFHWINPKTGLKRVYALLKQGGTLAFFWIQDNQKIPGPSKDKKQLYTKYKMKPKDRNTAKKVINQVKGSPLFTDIKYYEIPSIFYISKKHRINLLLTFSAVINLSEKNKQAYIKDAKKQLQKYSSPLRVPIITKLILARKK